MTEYNIKKLHAHFKFLASGKFTEIDFNKEYKASTGRDADDGYSRMGRMTADRKKLIMADAQRHLDKLEESHSFPKEVKPVEKKEKPISKEVKKEKK